MAQSRNQRRAQQQRLQDKWQRQIETQAAREAKAAAAAVRQANREQQQAYVAARLAETERDTADLTEWVDELRSILVNGLSRGARIDLAQRRRQLVVPRLQLGSLATPLTAPQWATYAPPEPGRLGKAFAPHAPSTPATARRPP